MAAIIRGRRSLIRVWWFSRAASAKSIFWKQPTHPAQQFDGNAPYCCIPAKDETWRIGLPMNSVGPIPMFASAICCWMSYRYFFAVLSGSPKPYRESNYDVWRAVAPLETSATAVAADLASDPARR